MVMNCHSPVTSQAGGLSSHLYFTDQGSMDPNPMLTAFGVPYGRQSIYGSGLGNYSGGQRLLSNLAYNRSTTVLHRPHSLDAGMHTEFNCLLPAHEQGVSDQNITSGSISAPGRYHRSRRSTSGSICSTQSLDFDSSSTNTLASSSSSTYDDVLGMQKSNQARAAHSINCSKSPTVHITENFSQRPHQRSPLKGHSIASSSQIPDSSHQVSKLAIQNDSPASRATNYEVVSRPVQSKSRQRPRSCHSISTSEYDVRCDELVLPSDHRRSISLADTKRRRHMLHHSPELHQFSPSLDVDEGTPSSSVLLQRSDQSEAGEQNSQYDDAFLPTSAAPGYEGAVIGPVSGPGVQRDQVPVKETTPEGDIFREPVVRPKSASFRTKEPQENSYSQSSVSSTPLRKSKSLTSLGSKIKTFFERRDQQRTESEARTEVPPPPDAHLASNSKRTTRNRKRESFITDISHRISGLWGSESSENRPGIEQQPEYNDDDRPAAGDVFPRNLDAHDVGAILSSIEYTESPERRPSQKGRHHTAETKVPNEHIIPAAPDFEFGVNNVTSEDDAVEDLDRPETKLKSRKESIRKLHKKKMKNNTVAFTSQILVYDTYSSSEYDRRPEPATCNRLTPTLAQQIKQELNTLKASMPIHDHSKDHTHFF